MHKGFIFISTWTQLIFDELYDAPCDFISEIILINIFIQSVFLVFFSPRKMFELPWIKISFELDLNHLTREVLHLLQITGA